MFNKTPNLNFMAIRKLMMAFSIVLLLGSVASMVIQQMEFGLDFTGGTQIEVAYPEAVDIDSVRAQLADKGFADASVQHFGKPSEILVRIQPREGVEAATIGDNVLAALTAQNSAARLQRVEFVGPQVGEELRDQSGSAMIFALILMLVYVTLRFRFKFAVGAVVALFHDVVIVLGFFSVTRMTFDLTVLAAILAVIGYSLNDTIVVADRIRENFRKLRKGDAIDIVNLSINETLGRTSITSLTTLLVLIALALFGGEMIYSFAIALIVGVVIGTYSSLYVASNILLAMNISREDFLEQEKEQVADMP